MFVCPTTASVITAVLAFPISWILTRLVLRYTLKRGILDIPNKRSSHAVATPRGGGLAIVITFLSGVCLLVALGVISAQLAMGILGGGILVSWIGWVDDKKGLSPLVRAGFHLAASIWAIYWLGGLPSLDLGFSRVRISLLGTCLATVGMVWSINLYNFMDGIDGIAATEAMSVGIVGGILAAISGAIDIAIISWILSFSCAGFLVWNWEPAKIFMGDVGSGFLGFIFAALAIATENRGTLPLFVWVLLLGVFLIDATATLIRRMVRGERWYEAHRSHAYQQAVKAGYTHKQVVLAVLAINAGLSILAGTIWLWPKYMMAFVLVGLGSLLALQLLIQHRFEGTGVVKPSIRF